MGVVYIIMGVSGVGKTTIGKALASALNYPFFDADDFHPQSNIDKMTAGFPLNDDDRMPWLDILSHKILEWSNTGAVLACSALKETYRKNLVMLLPTEKREYAAEFIYIEADFQVVHDRLLERNTHFFNPILLQSQFDTLEQPANALWVDGRQSQQQIINYILLKLQQPQLGLIGLGVMGKSLARNFADKGVQLSLYNRRVVDKEEDVAINFIAEHHSLSSAEGFEDIAAFVQSLKQPRSIFLMVNAGSVIDMVINVLQPHLDQGDILLDGGNSHYLDTERRVHELARKGINYIGVGVSGGEEGALKGPSIMPGGAAEHYHQVQPILEVIAAKDTQGEPCCTHIGSGGAGHYVKMIHNGIEYGEMQLITEVYDIMRFHLGMDIEVIAEIFDAWNNGPLKSYLLEITAKILRKKEEGHYLVDLILDKAQQKGTGSWSTTAALSIGQPFDTIASAVMVRNLSAQKMTRIVAGDTYRTSKTEMAGMNLGLEDLERAYTCGRIINHAIGFETIKAASKKYDWNIDLSELARVWTNGCIIRSRLMEDYIDVLKVDISSHVLLHKDLVEMLSKSHDAFAKTISTAALSKATAPTLSAAFNYFNGFITGDSATHLIQAQRDFFGAHTYERKDKEGKFHTDWE